MKGLGERKRRQICHCEERSDAAIRSPPTVPCITPCRWGRGFPRRCAPRLGMTGAVVFVTVFFSVVHPHGSMWVGRVRNARPTDLAGVCEAASTPTINEGGVEPRPYALLPYPLHRADRVVRPYDEIRSFTAKYLTTHLLRPIQRKEGGV